MQKTIFQKKLAREKTIFWLFNQPRIDKKETYGKREEKKETLKSPTEWLKS